MKLKNVYKLIYFYKFTYFTYFTLFPFYILLVLLILMPGVALKADDIDIQRRQQLLDCSEMPAKITDDNPSLNKLENHFNQMTEVKRCWKRKEDELKKIKKRTLAAFEKKLVAKIKNEVGTQTSSLIIQKITLIKLQKIYREFNRETKIAMNAYKELVSKYSTEYKPQLKAVLEELNYVISSLSSLSSLSTVDLASIPSQRTKIEQLNKSVQNKSNQLVSQLSIVSMNLHNIWEKYRTKFKVFDKFIIDNSLQNPPMAVIKEKIIPNIDNLLQILQNGQILVETKVTELLEKLNQKESQILLATASQVSRKKIKKSRLHNLSNNFLIKVTKLKQSLWRDRMVNVFEIELPLLEQKYHQMLAFMQHRQICEQVNQSSTFAYAYMAPGCNYIEPEFTKVSNYLKDILPALLKSYSSIILDSKMSQHEVLLEQILADVDQNNLVRAVTNWDFMVMMEVKNAGL